MCISACTWPKALLVELAVNAFVGVKLLRCLVVSGHELKDVFSPRLALARPRRLGVAFFVHFDIVFDFAGRARDSVARVDALLFTVAVSFRCEMQRICGIRY